MFSSITGLGVTIVQFVLMDNVVNFNIDFDEFIKSYWFEAYHDY